MAYTNITGFPSVTDILKPYIDTEWFKPEHTERGSSVHAACASHLLGLYVIPLPDDHQPYFDSFRRWLDLMKIEVITVEERISDEKMGFCGQLDFGCRVRADNLLVDIKTSQAKASWWIIQGAAYRHLYDNCSEHGRTDRGGSLRLMNDGRMALFDPWTKAYQREFNIFTGLLNAHKFFNI